MQQDKNPPTPEAEPDEPEPEDAREKSRPATEIWEDLKPAKIPKYDPGHWPNR